MTAEIYKPLQKPPPTLILAGVAAAALPTLAPVQKETNTISEKMVIIYGTIVLKRKYHNNVSWAVRQKLWVPPLLIMVPKYHPLMQECLLRTIAELHDSTETFDSSNDKTKTDNPKQQKHTHQMALILHMVGLFPDPNAFRVCLKLVSKGKLLVEILLIICAQQTQ